MRLVGIQATGPSSFNDEKGSGALFSAQLWHTFIDALIAAEVPLDQDLYGVSWPADALVPPQQIVYFCGFQSDADFEGMQTLDVAGGNYFDFHCAVVASDLDAGFHEAYMQAMPASGLKPRDGQHIEIYGDDYDPNDAIARFRILIPVE